MYALNCIADNLGLLRILRVADNLWNMLLDHRAAISPLGLLIIPMVDDNP